MRFFLIAAVLNPTPKQAEDGQQAEVILSPEFVLAKSQNQALMKVASKIDAKYLDNDRLDITAMELTSVGNALNNKDWKALVR